jgi:hypothetical protein
LICVVHDDRGGPRSMKRRKRLRGVAVVLRQERGEAA